MAVESVTENCKATASDSPDSSTRVRVFTVVMDEATDRVEDAMTAIGDTLAIPQRGATHPKHPWVTAKNVEAQHHDDDHLVFDVVVTYDNKPGVVAHFDDPTQNPPRIRWDSVDTLVEMTKDLDGKAVGTSAGVPFDPPPLIDDSKPWLVVSRLRNSFFPGTIQWYKDALNTDVFLGADPGQAKIKKHFGEYEPHGNRYYWRVTTQVLFDFSEHGFERPYLDRGSHEALPEGLGPHPPDAPTSPHAIMVPLVDPDGVPVLEDPDDPDSKPALVVTPTALNLDGAGRRLAPGLPPVELMFRRHKSVSFRTLGITQTVIDAMNNVQRWGPNG